MLAASQHLQVLLQLLHRAQLQAHGHVLAQPAVLLRQAPDKLRFLLLCGELSSASLRNSIRSKLASLGGFCQQLPPVLLGRCRTPQALSSRACAQIVAYSNAPVVTLSDGNP